MIVKIFVKMSFAEGGVVTPTWKSLEVGNTRVNILTLGNTPVIPPPPPLSYSGAYREFSTEIIIHVPNYGSVSKFNFATLSL